MLLHWREWHLKYPRNFILNPKRVSQVFEWFGLHWKLQLLLGPEFVRYHVMLHESRGEGSGWKQLTFIGYANLSDVVLDFKTSFLLLLRPLMRQSRIFLQVIELKSHMLNLTTGYYIFAPYSKLCSFDILYNSNAKLLVKVKKIAKPESVLRKVMSLLC